MHQPAQHGKCGSYTASLLGNIRSHLAGLQGYDVMALELIQNADDAKAEAPAPLPPGAARVAVLRTPGANAPHAIARP